MARNAGSSAGAWGRLDVPGRQVHSEPPGAVDASADRRARALVAVGNLLLWSVILVWVALLVRAGIVDGSADPTSSTWRTVAVVGAPLSLACIAWADRMRRKKTGYPVPSAVSETVVQGTEAARETHERLKALEATVGRPGFVGERHHANARELRLIGRHCDSATRAERLLPWMMRLRVRRISSLSASLRRRADELSPSSGERSGSGARG